MTEFNHIVIYSHGFGVRKDDRGLFTDIAAALSDTQHIMFDYSQIDEATNNLTVAPLGKQAKKLSQIIAETKAANPNAIIDLICHSQGCVVACLAKLAGVRKVVFTGPPAELSVDHMIRIFAARPGSEINLHGISRLQRTDFSTTIVPQEYWKSIERIDPIHLYNELAKTIQLTLINATEDEIIGNKDFRGLSPEIEVIEIKTGHNFEGDGRRELVRRLRSELV